MSPIIKLRRCDISLCVNLTPRRSYRGLPHAPGHSTDQRHLSTTHTLDNTAMQQSNFLGEFFKTHRCSENTIKFFSSIPWTREILQNENYRTVPLFSRYLNETTGENRFFAKSVNSHETIPHLLALKTIEQRGPEETSSYPLIFLISLRQGLDSHPSIVHGGFQGVILDEVARNMILMHHDATCDPVPRDTHFTASMTISYVVPVTTPGVYLVRSQLTRREGRKWYTKAEIVDSSDKVLTNAESFWVTAKRC
ncbi:unnamed protein product [Penicillium olsonii]|nr:unnamed protein product [Penicillium olsonii]